MDSTASASFFASIGFALALVVVLTGCACGNHGTLVARRTVVPGAEIIDVFAFGALFRPLGFDTGLSFGYRHASYIYPLPAPAAKNAESPTVEWHWFYAPPAPGPPLLRASTTIGVEAQVTPEIKRCTLGYLDQVLTIGGGPTDSMLVKLFYDRHHPLQTALQYRKD